MLEFSLQSPSPQKWLSCVLDNFDDFLQDHASCEKKASGMALKLISHFPDRIEMLPTLTDLAIEELTHYKEVIKLLLKRGLHPTGDIKDTYIQEIQQYIRRGTDLYLMDQLILGAIIEARGYERFDMIAKALPEGEEKKFYTAISHSEKRHYELFLSLCSLYFPQPEIQMRLNNLLKIESKIMLSLPYHAKLH